MSDDDDDSRETKDIFHYHTLCYTPLDSFDALRIAINSLSSTASFLSRVLLRFWWYPSRPKVSILMRHYNLA